MDASKKYLIDYYTALQKRSISNMKSEWKNFRHSEIHKFRVSVKQINAFNSFINFIDKDFESKQKELEAIYTLCGKLRTYGILKKQLKSLHLYDGHWKKYFRQKIKGVKEKCRIEIREYLNDSFSSLEQAVSRISFILPEESKLSETAGEYMNNISDRIKRFRVSEEPGKSSLHDLRKLMKEFGYNYNMLTEAFYKLKNDRVIYEIDSLNKILGRWHDKIVFRKFILKQKDFEISDKLAHQTALDIKKDEDEIILKHQIFDASDLKELNF